VFYVAYLFFATANPLWDGIVAETILSIVNLVMILIILLERSTIGMSEAACRLHSGLRLLAPGQIRRLVKVCEIIPSADAPEILTAGVRPDRLYYLTEGSVDLTKGSDTVELHGPLFLGEIAWLTGGAASATVRLRPGAVCLGWRHGDLRRLMDRRPAIGNGLAALLNADLAAKLALSQPGLRFDAPAPVPVPVPAASGGPEENVSP